MRFPRFSNSPIRRLAVTCVAFLAVLLSCGKDVTAPGARGAKGGLLGNFAVAPQFPEILTQTAGAGGTVSFNRVRIVLRRVDLTIALDRTVDFPASATTVPLTLDVPLLASTTASGESFTLTLEYLNSDGAIVFTGGPTSIVVTPTIPGSTTPPPVVDVPVKYSGPGANAAKVTIAPKSLAVPSGAAFSFTAQALDASNAVLAGTPIVFTSLDPTLATVSAAGTGTAIGVRGTARIVAQLLTGQTDIATITIQPVATAIAIVSGGGQTNSAGTTLPLPLVVKVTAADGLGVAGASVAFAATTGGGTVTSTSTTDASGNAQATWKLGATVGAQSVTANGGTAGQVVFAATATAATPTKLVVTSAPTSGTATNALADFVVTAQDANNNVVSAFTGPVTVSLGGGTVGATLSGTTTVNAVGGVATFTALGIGKTGTAYTLTASASGLTAATSAPFDIIAGTANKLVFTGQPTDALAGASVGTLSVAVQDASGNPITTFTGPVTLGLALNPGAATIGGTTTVTAVAGVATFTGISLNRPGSGYAFVASAVGLASGNSGTFSISIGAASTIALVSGGAQSGAASSALALPIVVRVSDAAGNAVTGKVLTIAVTTGGGTVTPTSVTTIAGGLATVNWTLGALVGAQSIAVSGSGLAPSPLTVTATATGALLYSKTWNGSAGTSWSTAANWTPSGVPTATDSVLVPSDSPQLTLGSVATIKHLSISSGASVTLASATLTVSGNLVATGGITGAGVVALAAPSAAKVNGSIAVPVIVTGPYVANGAFSANGLTINSGGSFDAAAQSSTINGALTTSGTGVFKMTSPGGAVNVTGSASFGGGSTLGQLTNGVLTVSGNFAEGGGSVSAFAASSGHQTVLNGASARTISFVDAGPSGFGALTTAGASFTASTNILTMNFTLSSGAVVGTGVGISIFGTLTDPSGLLQFSSISFGSSTTPVSASTPSITVAGGGSLTFNNNPSILAANLNLTATTVFVLGNLSLTSHTLAIAGDFSTSSAGQLTMSNALDSVKVSGNVTFGSMSAGGPMSNGVMLVGGNFTQSGSIQSLSTFGTNTIVLNGAGAQTVNFSNPDGAYTTGCAASCFANLNITKSTGSVAFQTKTKITVNYTNLSGASLTTPATNGDFIIVGSAQLAGNGAYHKIGLASGTYGKSGVTTVDSVVWFGTSQAYNPSTLAETFDDIRGTVNWVNPSSMNGNVQVSNNGQLNIATSGAVINGQFITTANATVRMMTNATDSLHVKGFVQFGGGSTDGLLTTGYFIADSTFGIGGLSYSSTLNHTTVLGGANLQKIFVAAPFIGKGLNKVWARGAGEKRLFDVIVYAASVDIGASVTSGVTGFTWVLSGGITDSSSMSGGAWRPNATNFTAAPTALPRNLNGTVAFKAGNVTLADTLYVGANSSSAQAQIVVDGGSTVLTLNGFKLQIDTVVGVFTTQNGGKLNMTNAADTLKASDFFFGGGNGTLNTGTIFAFGNFTQSASGNAFVASGSHKTVGAKTATYKFANPTTSYFNDFTIVAGSTVTLSSDVTIKGTLGFSGSLAATFTDTSLRTITASGLNLPGLYPVYFTNVALNYVDGVIGATTFNNGSFSGFGAFFTGNMLSLNRTSGLPPTFINLAFAGTLSDGVGRYISNTGSIPLALVSATPNSTAALSICGCTGTNYRSTTGVTWP